MSDLDILIVTFQTQLSGLMETVLKTAMYEVTRLVEDGLMEEVRRRSQEVELLRTQLQWAERKLNDDGLVKREHKGRCVNCGAADVNVSFDVAEERPTNVHYSVLKRCDLKEEGNTAEGCSPEVVFEATGSGELTPDLSPAKESLDVEEDRVKIEDFDKSFCAVHLGGWGVGHDGETGADSISQNEVADTGTEQKHRNSEESLLTTIKQDLLTGATHTFNEDQEDVCTQYTQVLAEPTQISPSESKMAALTLRRADAGLSQHYTARTLEQECEPTLTKSSPKQMVRQLLDTASVWPQGRNLSSSSKSSVESWGQTSQVDDVVIKQEIIVDSDEDEDEEEDKERLDEEETMPGSVSSFSESEHMLRPEALKRNITHNPPGQEALRLHAKVSANVTLQAGVQHCARPIKKTCHTLTASAATAHSHVRHFNLNRTPSTSKLALPPSVAVLSRPGLPWISTRTHHGTSSPLHQVSHLPGARHLLRCGQCGKGFPHPSNLKAHLKTHTGERPFGCSLCGRSFTKLSNLKAHRRVHTGERPYCCSSCGKRFTQKCNLKRHQRIHLDT